MLVLQGSPPLGHTGTRDVTLTGADTPVIVLGVSVLHGECRRGWGPLASGEVRRPRGLLVTVPPRAGTRQHSSWCVQGLQNSHGMTLVPILSARV